MFILSIAHYWWKISCEYFVYLLEGVNLTPRYMSEKISGDAIKNRMSSAKAAALWSVLPTAYSKWSLTNDLYKGKMESTIPLLIWKEPQWLQQLNFKTCLPLFSHITCWIYRTSLQYRGYNVYARGVQPTAQESSACGPRHVWKNPLQKKATEARMDGCRGCRAYLFA